MVATIDQGDAQRRIGQRSAGPEPGETSADDDKMRVLRHDVLRCGRCTGRGGGLSAHIIALMCFETAMTDTGGQLAAMESPRV